MRAFVLIAVATLIFLSKGAPAPTAPKSADGVLKSALSALEKAMKDVKLTPQQIQNLEKPNLEREEMLLQHGVVFCRTVKKECAAHPEADCTLQLKQGPLEMERDLRSILDVAKDPSPEAVNYIRDLIAHRKYLASTVRAKDGKAALHLAVIAGNFDLVEALVKEYDCDIAMVDNEGRTPLHYAGIYNRQKITTFLFINGADATLRDEHGVTAFHYAATRCMVSVTFDHFLKWTNNKVENLFDNDGRSVFMWLVVGGHTNMVRRFVWDDRIVTPRNEVDKDGNTALHLAAKVGNLKICKLLFEEGWSPIDGNKSSSTPVHVAAAYGHTDIVKYFTREANMAEVDLRDALGRTPIFHACMGGHVETLREMIHRLGYSIDTRDVLNGALLHAAAFAGRHECVKELIDSGAYVTDTNKDDFTALHIAAERGKLECCRRLLHGGAAVNALSKVERQTPLSLAIINGHDNVIDYLKSKGGMTPDEVKMVASYIIQRKGRKRQIELVQQAEKKAAQTKPRRRSSSFLSRVGLR
ncbi:hypothetical protein QR680_012334 [Steinernema hermaphroditum]|uniref:Uncharacterized protein n=1 Tax=Steinernema hermaphroditum TaxID=289476 RepID=A0AA39I325_9BILA|nr:hypothetical protein QR680_012334 [Steinernema hermaphroditum]